MSKEMNAGRVEGLDRSAPTRIQWVSIGCYPLDPLDPLPVQGFSAIGTGTSVGSWTPAAFCLAKQAACVSLTALDAGNPHAFYLAFISSFSVQKIIENSID